MLENIKKFFDRLFSKNNLQYIEAPKNETNDKEDLSINLDLKTQTLDINEEESKTLKLQKDFKLGLVNEEDLSEEEFNSLYKLYENQINKTKKSIEEYREKITNLKDKLA